MHAELTIEIARPPADVFAYLTDVSNLPVWQTGVRSAAVVGGGEAAVGARIVESRHLLGREFETTLAVEEYEPPRVFALRTLDGPVELFVRHVLDPGGAGTLLRVTGEGDPARLPGFAAGMIGRRVEKQFRRDFDRLRQQLERR